MHLFRRRLYGVDAHGHYYYFFLFYYFFIIITIVKSEYMKPYRRIIEANGKRHNVATGRSVCGRLCIHCGGSRGVWLIVCPSLLQSDVRMSSCCPD